LSASLTDAFASRAQRGFVSLPDDYIQGVLDDLHDKAAIYGKAKAKRIGLEEQRKITKAQLMKVCEVSQNITSAAHQEREAYAHPTYLSIVKQLEVAVEAEVTAEYDCKLLEMQWESWRSINASLRAAGGTLNR
jgi:hypothetical protein